MKRLKRIVKDYAFELGFDMVGVTSAETFESDRIITLQRIKAGLMEGMPWFTQSRVNRGSVPSELLPGARSIISVGLSYYLPKDGEGVGLRGKVARYAWGDDYHKVIKSRLREYVQGLPSRLSVEVRASWYVDDGPMLDRAVAQRTGIGWFGKNTNILSQSHGSWIFLGQVVTDLDLEPDLPLKKTCGDCVRCIDACPTGAIVAPYVLDSPKCISYLTIENRGEIPRNLRPMMSDWVFGCDICQDVCPVNVKAMYSTEQAFQRKRFTSLQLIEMLEMNEEEFSQRFSNSPLKRAKLRGLKRNVCVALGNSGDMSAVPVLVKALRRDVTLVRLHAAWALGQLGGQEALESLELALRLESDEGVRQEIKVALSELRIMEALH